MQGQQNPSNSGQANANQARPGTPGVAFLPNANGAQQRPTSQAFPSNSHPANPPQSRPFFHPQMAPAGATHTQQYLHQSLPLGSSGLQMAPQTVLHQTSGPLGSLAQQYGRPNMSQMPLQNRPAPNLTGYQMAAAIDLLAQGQRAYANAQRPGPPQFPSAMPYSTGQVGRPKLGTSAAASTAAPRKYNKKRKAPDAPTMAPAPKQNVVVPLKMPASALFTELQSMDEAIMKSIAAQKKEIRHALHPEEHLKKRLRIYIQSEHFNQPNTAPRDPREPPSWNVTIWGRLIDGIGAANLSGPRNPTGGSHKAKPLAVYLKSLAIRTNGGSEAEKKPPLVWEKSSHTKELRDRFFFRQEGSSEVELEIEVMPDSSPSFWQPDAALAKLLNLRPGPRSAILASFINYVKTHNLQMDKDRIKADAKLEELFGEIVLKYSELPALLDKYLVLLGPYRIPFTVRPSIGRKSAQLCFDVDLCVAVRPEDKQMAPPIDQLQPDPELDQLQLKINGLVGAAIERARRRDLLLGFGADPQAFINEIIESQARDVRTQGKTENAALRKTEFLQSRWVENAVLRYLHRKMAAGG